MLSTMQDVPLLISRILTHGSTIHGTSQVITWTGEGEPQRRSFAEIGARAAQLAHALREDLGVVGDDRVATLMWNNAEHVEAYFAIPSMGAVLHTLNLRLPPEQLAWIVNHAADRVVIANGSLLPLLAPLLPHLKTVEHVVVSGPGDRSLLDGAQCAGARVRGADRRTSPTTYDWPELDERHGRGHVLHLRHHRRPQGRRLLPPLRSICTPCRSTWPQSMGLTDLDTSLVVVPQFHVNAWGLPHATFMTGVNMLMPDRFLQPGPLAEMIESERPTHAAAVPTIWQGLLAELNAKPAGRRLAHAGHHRRLGLSALADGGVRRAGHARLPRLGHDGDLAARHDRPPAGPCHRHRGGVRRTGSPRAVSPPASRPG